MAIVNHRDIKDPEVFEGVFSRQLVNRAQAGAASITTGELKIKPDCTLPEHYHFVEEALVVIEGEGRLVLEGAEQDFGASATILIPAGKRHKITNTGTQMLKMYYSFPSIEVDRVLIEE